MTAQQVFAVGQQGLFQLLLVAAPLLLSGLVVGLVVSIFQAATQINEATLSFVPKIIAAVVVLIGLALFLTFFVMQPVLEQSWVQGLQPMAEGRIGEMEGLRLAAEPFRTFMAANVRQEDLRLFLDLAKLPDPASAEQTPWRALVPAFMVGELRRAFEMGFLLYLPFLVIEMVVASVLMSLGMMMLSPVLVALPFKLMLFVLADGWNLLLGSLAASFAT